jgi:heptosyltransferase-2
MSTKPKKILVRTPNWLGDLVMSLGFFHKLRKVFPDASVEAIAKAEISDLLELVPGISSIHPFSKSAVSRCAGRLSLCGALQGSGYLLFSA